MTDKKTEALKLAQEALEEIHLGNMTPMAEEAWNKAITAIREALAEQPAQQQEPVAHQYQDREGVWRDFMNEKHYKDTVADGTWPIRSLCVCALQPANKPWVGLTDEEIKEAIIANCGTGLWVMANDIEAKLKEKNT